MLKKVRGIQPKTPIIPAIPDIKINDLVKIRPMNHPQYPGRPRTGLATVVAIIGKGTELTEEEAVHVYGTSILTMKDKHGRPISTKMFTRPRDCDLIVLKRLDSETEDGFFVQPNATLRSWLTFPLEVIPKEKREKTLRYFNQYSYNGGQTNGNIQN